ncbi:MAG: hypothetical protein V4614_02285 [Pseudomonadota bacterium]
MYDKSDPRATLSSNPAPTTAPLDAATPFGTASCIHFKQDKPAVEDPLYTQWIGRGHNFMVCYVEAKAGARIVRKTQPDEFVILSYQHSTELRVESGHGSEDIPGYSVVVVPAGNSTVEVKTAGSFFILYTTQSKDLAAKASNAAAYADPRHHVAPWAPWPAPVDGPKVRRYSMEVANEPGRFGRIWRCSTFMVNLFVETAPRDVEKVSPHYHDDFEQGSLLMTGTMSHHVRWPWTTNMRNWLPDKHMDCGSPSLAVIPPPAIHTSNGTGTELRLMVDVFCPPRIDFSQKPGWVLNAADYPMPSGQTAGA